METLIYLVLNVIRVYAICILVGVFLQKKDIGEWAYLCSYIAFFTVNSILYLKLNTIIINIASNLIPIFLITFLYNSKIWKKAFVTVLVYAIAMFWDSVVCSFDCIKHRECFKRFVCVVDNVVCDCTVRTYLYEAKISGAFDY